MSVIIGINAFHGDASACLLIDGKLIFAAEEERFRRIKHWAGFPAESIRACLMHANLRLPDVDVIAVNSDSQANLVKKLGYTITGNLGLNFAKNRLKAATKKSGVEDYLERDFGEGTFKGVVRRVEHHLAHLASAHIVSPFEDSVVLSVDGLGDFVSTAWGLGKGSDVKMHGKVFFPHSLGIFYEAMTHFLGFKHYGDEYKVMGLAPYGRPVYEHEMQQLVVLKDNGEFELNLEYFSHQRGGGQHTWEDGIPVSGDCFADSMSELFGKPRADTEELTQKHMDIAHSVQLVYEKAFFHLINHLHEHYQNDRITLAGGCAMNSVANGKIYRQSPYKAVYIQSAAGDAGGAIGAAYIAAKELGETETRYPMEHAYFGPWFSNDYHENLILDREAEIRDVGCVATKIEDEFELCQKTAQAISEGLVIGWFQGRMEWGPRALGNRSILCDPRRADMKDILNLKIKRRESFRPFAPSILREKVGEWFEEEDDVPFMMQVFQILQSKRSEIPAVTHVDGSGRLHTVIAKTNPMYHKLISSFEQLTGVPILLNTSFNENEPVVCRPEEALNTFLRTQMDVLVLGNWFVYRNLKN